MTQRGIGVTTWVRIAICDLQTIALTGCGECPSMNCPRCYTLFVRCAILALMELLPDGEP